MSCIVRPAPFGEAWPLAWDHYRLADDEFLTTGIEVRDRARALVDARRWMLESRP